MRSLIGKKSDIPGVYRIKTGAELLSDHYMRRKLKEIKQLVSVTSNEWSNYYLGSMCHFAAYVQSLPDMLHEEYRCDNGLLKYSLDRTVVALKLRQGYMLPLDGDTETCYREQDVWTLAVFVASLFEPAWQVPANFKVAYCDKHGVGMDVWGSLAGIPMSGEKRSCYRPSMDAAFAGNINYLKIMLIRSLITNNVMLVFSPFKKLFQDWVSFLTNSTDTENAFCKIINVASSTLTKPKTNDVEGLDVDKQSQEQKPIDLVTEFLAWLQASVLSESVTFNEQDSILHVVNEGVILLSPDCFEHFAADPKQQTKAALAEIDDVEDFFLQKIAMSDYGFILNQETNSYLYDDYQLGESLDHRGLVSLNCLLIDPAMVFSAMDLPQVSALIKYV